MRLRGELQFFIVDRSCRSFALAETWTFPLSTPKVADVYISASLSCVLPMAELKWDSTSNQQARTACNSPLRYPVNINPFTRYALR